MNQRSGSLVEVRDHLDLAASFPHGFRTVVFDCDSTLSEIEGINELAFEHRNEVEALTEAAMRGEIPLDAVYGRRLELIRPTRRDIDRIGAMYVERVVTDVARTCDALMSAGVDVRVVSGGLLPAVLQLTRHLRIPDANVAAVDIYFDEAGNYAGFDTSSPLARSGGKPVLLESWLRGIERPVMMVGDGSTDLEVAPIVDLFVAFAGVIARENVITAADVVVHAPSLWPIASLALANAER